MFSLVGWIFGAKPVFGRLKGFVRSKWGDENMVSVSELKLVIFIFKFAKEEDCNRVFAMGPWSFDNRPLIIKPWSPDENYELESVTALPVWVRFPGLNMHMHNEEILSMIASTIGKPIRTDDFTAGSEKLSYARVLIEVFEHCHRFGHEVNQCPLPRLRIDEEEGDDPKVLLDPDIEEIAEKRDCEVLGSKDRKNTQGAVVESPESKNGSSEFLESNVPDIALDGGVLKSAEDKGLASSAEAMSSNGQEGIESFEDSKVSIESEEPFTEVKRKLKKEITWNNIGSMVGFVYAMNSQRERRELWNLIVDDMDRVKGPWMFSGDFNCVKNQSEKLNGRRVREADGSEITDLCEQTGLFDMSAIGNFFTWSNRHELGSRIWCKLDRILYNEELLASFPSIHGLFPDPGISDHCPAISVLGQKLPFKPWFRFQAFWTKTEEFKSCLSHWQSGAGDLVQLQKRLKVFKSVVKQGLKNFRGDMNIRVDQHRQNLLAVQGSLAANPNCVFLRRQEAHEMVEFRKLLKYQFIFNCQRARLNWAKEGDLNSRYFHAVIKGRRARNAIRCLKVEGGEFSFDPSVIKNQLVKYFKDSFNGSFSRVQIDQAEMCAASWNIIGPDVVNCISCFMRTGVMPSANRLKPVLKYLVNQSQSAFIEGRNIAYNISLFQELLGNYKRKHVSKRCMLKLDISKAYDSVEWDFLKQAMEIFGFPVRFIQWIMACVSSVKFSVLVNGGLEGYFGSRRGLRQGDPMSPYLFTLVMEVLSRLLVNLKRSGSFSFHPKCGRNNLNHLMFADDVIIFSKACPSSLLKIKEALNSFKEWSGLNISEEKSAIYFGGCSEDEENLLASLANFQKGQLPFNYLGVPLHGKRLKGSEFSLIIDKMTNKIKSWSSRFLSYAGRLVLVKHVLSSIGSYWMRVLIFPK
ncbi:hypothetical protein QQ045_020136 [Rhodiola kirilowii]